MKIIENKSFVGWFQNGIIFGMFKKDCIITLEAAEEIIKFRGSAQNSKDHLHLIYISHIGIITPDAKKFFAKEGQNGIKKLALVTTDPFKVVLGNLWIRNDKPLKLARLFNTKEEAVNWLKSEKLVVSA